MDNHFGWIGDFGGWIVLSDGYWLVVHRFGTSDYPTNSCFCRCFDTDKESGCVEHQVANSEAGLILNGMCRYKLMQRLLERILIIELDVALNAGNGVVGQV